MYQEEILQINGVRLWTAVQGEGIPRVEKPDEVKAALRQFVVDYVIHDTI